MIEQYVDWVKQAREAVEKWGETSLKGVYRLLVVAGMGGSGIVGDYIASLSQRYGGLPVFVVKHHVPPEFIGGEDLVVVISYSGNTVETLDFLRRVRGKTRNIVLVSSNGVLESVAEEEKYLFIRVPRGYVPRTSLPYMLVSLLGFLDASGYRVVDKREVVETIEFIENEIDSVLELGEDIAGFIDKNQGILVLASHSPYEPLLVRGKNEFNENSKILVKTECAPEWMHNDIVGWEKPYANKYSVIAIKDVDDSIGSRLVEYMVSVYRESGVPVYELVLRGRGLFAKLFYGSLILGVASVYLAKRRGVDPLVTESIKRYKSVVNSIFKH